MQPHTPEERFVTALPGFRFASEVITPEAEERLIALVESCDLRSYPGDQVAGLCAISFGWKYDIGQAAFSPCARMPEGFAFLRDIAARFAGLGRDDFVQCLLNRYETGAAITWHCDKPIWEDVIGVSLGAPTTMRFRRALQDGYQYSDVELAPRSIYLLSGDVRRLFDHATRPVQQRRWSITFRTFSDEGRRLRDMAAG